MKRYTITVGILFIILVIAILGGLILAAKGLFFNDYYFYKGQPASEIIILRTKIIFIIKAIALILCVAGVYLLARRVYFIVNQDFFNQRLIKSLLKSGILFLISGLVGLFSFVISLVNFIICKDQFGYLNLSIDSKSLYIMLMILGFFLILFSKALKRGSFLKQENDLTI